MLIALAFTKTLLLFMYFGSYGNLNVPQTYSWKNKNLH